MSQRRPFPQLNSFRPWVSEELKKRRSTWPTPISAPFARMTSCNEDDINNYKYFTLGLHGFDAGDSINLFDLTYGSNRDIVGYAYRNGQKVLISSDELKYVSPKISTFEQLPADDPQRRAIEDRTQQVQRQQSAPPVSKGAHPVPGLTGVQIKRSGLAAPLIAEVRWQCYNQQQLEFLRNHFMIIGTYVVLEWGQKYHDDAQRNRQLLDFSDSNSAMSDLLQSIVKGRKYVIDKFAQGNDGNYDFVVGQVANFTVDLDPATNIYKCSTRIVSLGENVWGMSTTQTATVLVKNDPTDANKLTDIHSYFEGQGSRFNQLLGRLADTSSGVKYCRPQQPAFKNNAPSAAQTGQVSPNPADAAFISWTALTNDVMNDIIEMFNGISSDGETQAMYDKLRKELRVLLGLGGPPDRNLPADIRQEQDRLYALEWVGNHPLLRSVDPDTMIVITQDIAANSPASEWSGNGIFGNGQIEKGKLTEGVWINAEMVREAFLKTTTLQAAIQQILTRMNVAVGNYWQLRLFYDDEVGVYKVIDYKFDHELENLKFYVFNSHDDTHHNETLDIKFDSAFPPELVSQMMAVSLIQTAEPKKQQELFQKYALLNNTSPFVFAVNWTSLKDVLKEQVKSYRDGYNITLGNTIKISATGKQNSETNSLAGSARIGGELNKGSQTGKSPAEAGSEGTNRTIVGSPLSIPPVIDSINLSPPRNTVAPPSGAPKFPFDSLPVRANPLVITSEVGARNVSNNPLASRDHKGVDIRAPQNTPVYAVKDGKVNAVNRNSATAGGLLRIGHTNGYETQYFHLSSIVVQPGQKVKAGELVGYSGGTTGTQGAGNSEQPHLHFELLRNGVPQNPNDSLSAVGQVAIKQPDGTLRPTRPSTVQTAVADVPASTTTTPPKTPTTPPTPATQNTTSPQQTERQIQEQAKLDAYKDKFGNNILNLIYPTVSILRNKITTDGYTNITNKKLVNAFISPFPTKTSVELQVPGITGISISDGFMVDKLPFIFANYGVFQVTEITDSVTDKGWFTTIRGYFKMLWPDGRGGNRDE